MPAPLCPRRRTARLPLRRRSLPDGPDERGLAHEAVLFDALGTLVELEPPWPPLRHVLRARHGIEVSDIAAKEAMLAEMAYYKAHHYEGTNVRSLRALRGRCAKVLRERLPQVATIGEDELVEALMESIRFHPYADAAPLLGRLRLVGVRTAVVSNWDVSLREVLAGVGLGGLLDEVVVSAEVGVRKPDPAIVNTALARLGCPARKALMVGDSPETDVAAARAAGVRAVFLDRANAGTDMPGVERIQTLASLEQLVLAPEPLRPRP